MSVHKKIQPIRSSRLAGYRQHIYMNVLFYYIDKKLCSLPFKSNELTQIRAECKFRGGRQAYGGLQSTLLYTLRYLMILSVPLVC